MIRFSFHQIEEYLFEIAIPGSRSYLKPNFDLNLTTWLSRSNSQHSDLIKDFPPVPSFAKEPEKFPEITVNVNKKIPPPIPRKDNINHQNVHKMKIITAKNASEVHRRKSPQHENQDLRHIVGTPVFSGSVRVAAA